MLNLKNKKGMLGNIIGGFVIVFVGIALMGALNQEIDNVLNCNSTAMNETLGEPLGPTDSFGGGGSGQFGGYDGEVKKSWSSNFAPYKTNETLILDFECGSLSPMQEDILIMVPIIFVIGVLLALLIIVYLPLRDVGVI